MKSRITALVLLLALCLSRDAAAHAFWVQPDDFWLNPRAVLSWTLQVGDAFSRQPSPIPAHRITRFEAMRFNAYLEAEGLTPALEHRARTHRMHADGFERYSRVAKSIVLVGARNGHVPDRVLRPFGLRLEIVPEVSPYAMPRPAQFPVRVLYGGEPLRGASVKLMNLDQQLAIEDEQRTNGAGVAIFSMPRGGSWLVSVVWTRPLTDASDADYETTFSSLTFGVPRSIASTGTAGCR